MVYQEQPQMLMFPHDSPVPSRMKSPWFPPTWVQRKLLKLINYFDDYYGTSGSPFLPCFMAGKNRWGGKGIKGELDFLVQGITAYYKSKHSVICLSLTPLCFSALCHSDMKWAEPDPGCIFTFPLENVWRSTIICFYPSRTLFWLGTDLASWVGVPPMPSFCDDFCLDLPGPCN